MRTTANIITILFHPIFLPLFVSSLIILCVGGDTFILDQTDFYLIGFFTLVIPSIVISVLRFGDFVSSIHLDKSSERIKVFLYVLLSFIVFIVIENQYIIGWSRILIFNLTFITFSLALLTFFIRVSIHSAAIWASIRLVLNVEIEYGGGNLILLLCILILIAGVIMTSRLFLNKHRPTEVYLGAILGFTCFVF